MQQCENIPSLQGCKLDVFFILQLQLQSMHIRISRHYYGDYDEL